MNQPNAPQGENHTPTPQPPHVMPYDTPATQAAPLHQQGHKKNSNAALLSMICSIAGFVTCMLTTLPGIILGHIALSKIKRSNGTLLGRGQAIAGIAVGYSSLLILIPALAAISAPIVIRQLALSRATTAMNNSREIYSNFQEYNKINGYLPQEDPNFTSSNDYLRMLFDAGAATKEKPFHVAGVPRALTPDENTSNGNALSKGENVFSYVLRAELYGKTPLLVAPLIKRGNTVLIDRSFGGQLVVLYTDGSTRTYKTNFTDYAEDPITGQVVFQDGLIWSTDPEGTPVGFKVVTPDL